MLGLILYLAAIALVIFGIYNIFEVHDYFWGCVLIVVGAVVAYSPSFIGRNGAPPSV